MLDHSQPFTKGGSITSLPIRTPRTPRDARQKDRMLEVSIVVMCGRVRKKTNDLKLSTSPVWNSKILLDVEDQFDPDGNPSSSVPGPVDPICTIQIWYHVPVEGDENGEELSAGKLLLSRRDISPLAKDRSLAWYPLIAKPEMDNCCSLDSCLRPKTQIRDQIPQVRLGFRWAWRDRGTPRQAASTTPIHITVQPLGFGCGSLRPMPRREQDVERGRHTYTRVPPASSNFAEHDVLTQPRPKCDTKRSCLPFDVDAEGEPEGREGGGDKEDESWVEELLTQIGESLLGLLPATAPPRSPQNVDGEASSATNAVQAARTAAASTPRHGGVVHDLSQDVNPCCTPRTRLEARVPAESRKVGVGINLIINDRRDLVVVGLHKAGAAKQSGDVELGDVVVELDGRSVGEAMVARGMDGGPGTDWDALLEGEAGEELALTLKRYDARSLSTADATGSHSLHRVRLTRTKIPSQPRAAVASAARGSLRTPRGEAEVEPR